MKAKFLLMLSVLVVIWMPTFSNSADTSSEIKLRAVTHFPPMHGQAKLLGEFWKEVEKRTNGKVKTTYYAGGTLLDAPRIYGGIVQGIADIGLAGFHFSAGRFPVMETTYLPVGIVSGYVGVHTFNDFYRKFKPKELDDVHVFFCFGGSTHALITKKPVYKLEDLKGLAIRAIGRCAMVSEALGAVPRPLELSEGYDAASRGLLDGFCINVEAVQQWKLGDVTKSITSIWQIGHTMGFVLAMNKNTWNMLPLEIQKVFTEISENYVEKTALLWDEIDIKAKHYALQIGTKMIELTPEEGNRWKLVVEKKVIDSYLKERVAAGFASEEIKSYIDFLKERVEYWTKRQEKLGIKSIYGPEEIRIK